jgi:GTP cyclohydrolase I
VKDATAAAWAKVISSLGYDAKDPHLADSAKRVARFFQSWHTNRTKEPKLTVFPNAEKYDELVVVAGIQFYSLCAHHGLPFFGQAAVGYLPTQSIVGLSKIARVVDHYARQFQTQERLTAQVAAFLERKLKPKGVGVVLQAEHFCMSMRGIQKPGHSTTTSAMRGVFLSKPEARAEFLSLVRG